MGYRTSRRNRKLNRVKKLETEVKILRNRNRVLEIVVKETNSEYYRKFLNMENKVFETKGLYDSLSKKVAEIEQQGLKNERDIHFVDKASRERYHVIKDRLKRKMDMPNVKRHLSIVAAVFVLCIAGVFII